jgi:hypothetical protein
LVTQSKDDRSGSRGIATAKLVSVAEVAVAVSPVEAAETVAVVMRVQLKNSREQPGKK